MARFVFITDLDGTLLDRESYSWAAAEQALIRLRRSGHPLIFCTSKTRAETELLRTATENEHPFIVENGGALFIPHGYFPTEPEGAETRSDYAVVRLGDDYADLIRTLEACAAETGVAIRAFHSMSPEQVAQLCDLPLTDAILARRREFDEAFEIVDRQSAPRLRAAIEARGKRFTEGGRLFHILGNNDKATAVRRLIALYRRQWPDVLAVGLGDALNDAGFLREMDRAVLVRSPHSEQLAALVPSGRVTALPGPAGWNDAVLGILNGSQ
jgi:mannosyl-3-phosphoglycerate phosphatase